jgi:hypothetical protein
MVFFAWCIGMGVLIVTGQGGSDAGSVIAGTVGTYLAGLVLFLIPRGGFRRRVKLVTAADERHAGPSSRDVAYVLVGLCVAWEAVVVALTSGAPAWLGYVAAFTVIPVGTAIALLLTRRSRPKK